MSTWDSIFTNVVSHGLKAVADGLDEERHASQLTDFEQKLNAYKLQLDERHRTLSHAWLALIESIKQVPELREQMTTYLARQGMCIVEIERMCRQTLERGV